VTPKTLTVLAEILGFLASVALIYQTVRLLRHQRTVRDLRTAVENLEKLKASASSDKESRREVIELAEEGIKALEGTIIDWGLAKIPSLIS
jgi:hypothetical protein